MREQIRGAKFVAEPTVRERHDASDDQQEGRDPVRDAAEDLEPAARSEAEQIQAKADASSSQDEDRREVRLSASGVAEGPNTTSTLAATKSSSEGK